MNLTKNQLTLGLIAILIVGTVAVGGYGLLYWKTEMFTKTIAITSSFDAKANFMWTDVAYPGAKPYDTIPTHDDFVSNGEHFTDNMIGVISDSASNVAENYVKVVVTGTYIQAGGTVDVVINAVELREDPSWSVPQRMHLSTIQDVQLGMDAVKVSDLFGGTGDTWLIESDWITELHYLEFTFTYEDDGTLPAGDYDMNIEIEMGDSTL